VRLKREAHVEAQKDFYTWLLGPIGAVVSNLSTQALSLTFFLSTIPISLLSHQPPTHRISRPRILTIATGPYTMNPNHSSVDLERQDSQTTPGDRVFFSLSHSIPFG
jgi:hypothetical protein